MASCAGRFHGAEEGAQKFSVDLRSESVDIDSLPCEKFARVLGAIDARGLDVNLLESGGRQLAAVFALFAARRQCNRPTPARSGEFRARSLRG